ncbi:MAG: fasciclin domain-containing protein [Prevotella sp.]|nr:fasciclin domain-containing protein [Prevotella sp.]
MNSKINKRQLIGATLIFCQISFGMTACSEWDDHYEADSSVLDSQKATLWENISSNGSLSQFASLLKKAGYDDVLSATQTYTVWAPTDGTFDYEKLSALSTDRLQKEFIENHIARNNYPISGSFSKQIYTLNEKLMNFDNSTIQGITLSQSNLASRNGTIHTLSGKIPFMQNIFESLNTNDYELDSIADFFHSYDVKKLNVEKSVTGPMENGQITYLDSVFDEHNELFTRYQAFINREDSNYTMLMPTNEAWRRARVAIEPYFNYVPSFEFMENTSTTEAKKVTVDIKDVAYLKDSIIHQMLTSSLFYNNNIYDNRKLNALQTGQQLQCDSLYSTTTTKIYTEDARNLFANATRIDKSNGSVWLTDTMQMHHWTLWNPEIIVQGENRAMLSSTVNDDGAPERKSITPGTQNPEVYGHLSNNSYIEVRPSSQSTNPGVVYYLPGVRSTTYSVYVVMVPASIESANIEAKPNKFNATMGYTNLKGKNEDRDRSWLLESYFVTDSTRVDTVYLGDFTFPVAYIGTGDYYPYIRINSSVTSRERSKYDRTLRIDCVIFRPKDFDNYLKEHPDYKYDTGTL